MYSLNNTIIACSTNLSLTSAIGIIRISGENILESIAPFISLDIRKIKNRFAHFIKIQGLNKETIDEGILLFFKGPNSYTGQDIVELQVHGNPLLLKKIIYLFESECGFSTAHEGEFTYRALKNKKMNLTQVEGLDLLIHGKSDYVINEGKSLLSGELNQLYCNLHQHFLSAKSSLEILINFTEDIDEDYAQTEFYKSIEKFKANLELLHKRVSLSGNKILKPRIVLSGRPNAGKSSFFNRLLNKNRSIVNEAAGTTRDYVSEGLFIHGNEFELIDTAGLRETEDSIESQGVEKAEDIISSCFYNIYLVDVTDITEEDVQNINKSNPDLVIINKSDLISTDSFTQPFEDYFSNFSTLPHSVEQDFDAEDFFEKINRKFNDLTASAPILLERHSDIINDLNDKIKLDLFSSSNYESFDAGIISSELLIIQTKIESLIGVLSSDQVLDNIFSNYCVGK
ncbi:tRNA uridine-5-carboxymethylaminomethyl(34) synthesis GTPase MnmE [Bacteriovoracaceae bacterium]|nr:tRNA uridine-5-carboxymethylaminomethyl(34) synthesis GTPase MnmE [Bacteriovoracaceae bacterium]